MSRLFSILITSLIIVSCASNEIGNSKDVNPETIWFDYRISGEEGKEEVTTLLQFRFAGETGTTLVLNEPASVALDDVVIKGDSNKMTGAYYEVIKPVHEFIGKHKIVFTDRDKKTYKEEFEFMPFKLRAEIPGQIKRGELVFEMDGLNEIDYVRIYASDTSFESRGINRVDTVKNGRIVITVDELRNLVNGPIHIEFYKEDERPVKDGTKEGGRIAVNYGLKREFELKD